MRASKCASGYLAQELKGVVWCGEINLKRVVFEDPQNRDVVFKAQVRSPRKEHGEERGEIPGQIWRAVHSKRGSRRGGICLTLTVNAP